MNIIKNLEKEVAHLKKELEVVNEQNDEASKNAEMLQNFFNQKLIDEKGNPIYEECKMQNMKSS